MKVKLIPVIEIRYSHYYQENITSPQQGPYWSYPDEWDEYNALRFSLNGFENLGAPYLHGSVFYKISAINESSLIKIIQNHINGISRDDYNVYRICALSGGCVLNIDNQDILFPQYCGDLSDIAYWESIAFKNTKSYDLGHPQPVCEFFEQSLELNFAKTEFNEPFVPPPPVDVIKIDKKLLQTAFTEAKSELQNFAQTLIRINKTESLNIPNIDNILIWSNE